VQRAVIGQDQETLGGLVPLPTENTRAPAVPGPSRWAALGSVDVVMTHQACQEV